MINIISIGLILTGIACAGFYDTIKDKAENPILKDTQLLIGYERKDFIKWPIIFDMANIPHMFVSGLSGNGKTCMVEYAIRGKEVILINTDIRKDFKSVKARRINGNDKILEYLEDTIKNMFYREKPLFIVLDELLVLCISSKIEKAVMELLAIGRHFNIYIIGISQLGTKESCKFKDLFNTRVCFRQVEESSYRTVLGYSPENRNLRKRQFLFYSDRTGSGYTYDV